MKRPLALCLTGAAASLFAVTALAQDPAVTEDALPVPVGDTAVTEAPPDPDACPARELWPEAAWANKTEATASAKPAAVGALEAWAFPELSAAQEAAREGTRTEGLLVIQGGELLYERYGRGFGPETPHLSWSVSKTYVNALVGLAVQEGALSLSDSICEHVEVGNPENCEITVEHLLEFGSGLDWRETYEGDSPTTSSVIAMLYGEGRDDMARFVSSQPRRAPPGSVYQYSSGDTTLLASVVQAAMAHHGPDFPWTLLFEPLGMSTVVWERDAAGTLVGSSYVYAAPQDMARLGYLFLNDGCWQGERLLPAGWVEDSVRVNKPMRQRALDRDPDEVQGRQIWLNQGVPELGDPDRPWPDAPPDTYAARGHWKQAIAVVPSHDAVIVRVGDDRDGGFSYNTLFSLALGLTEPVAEPAPPTHAPGPAAESGESSALEFSTGLLSIGSAYGAKLACSCRYVVGQDEDYCRAWVKASPDIVKLRFDDEAKQVKGRALGLAPSSARWVSEREGCVLE